MCKLDCFCQSVHPKRLKNASGRIAVASMSMQTMNLLFGDIYVPDTNVPLLFSYYLVIGSTSIEFLLPDSTSPTAPFLHKLHISWVHIKQGLYVLGLLWSQPLTACVHKRHYLCACVWSGWILPSDVCDRYPPKMPCKCLLLWYICGIMLLGFQRFP